MKDKILVSNHKVSSEEYYIQNQNQKIQNQKHILYSRRFLFKQFVYGISELNFETHLASSIFLDDSNSEFIEEEVFKMFNKYH